MAVGEIAEQAAKRSTKQAAKEAAQQAVESATLAAKRAAKETADAAKLAANTARKSAEDLIAEANRLAKMALDTGSDAAKKLADDAAEAAKAARKKADDLESVAKKADDALEKVTKASDDVEGLSTELAKKSKNIKAQYIVGGGLVATAGAGFLYLDEKFKEEDKKIQNCISLCVPTNIDGHIYGDIKYKELTPRVKGENGIPEDFSGPLWTEESKKSNIKPEVYCSEKCEKAHKKTQLPGTAIAGRVGESVNDFFMKTLGLEGLGEGIRNFLFIFINIIIVGILYLFIASGLGLWPFNEKRNNN